ncbi:MAG: hypothetical protein QOH18_2214 [Solirubrobacterales bacterium]|nr:hypothetical protein [Solirubrobacterales bacterium]
MVATEARAAKRDSNGANVRYQDVLRWTAENSKLPDLGFWIDRVYYGTLCAVTVSEVEQGLAAGRIAYSILAEGKHASDFPMKPTTRGPAGYQPGSGEGPGDRGE